MTKSSAEVPLVRVPCLSTLLNDRLGLPFGLHGTRAIELSDEMHEIQVSQVNLVEVLGKHPTSNTADVAHSFG